MPSTRRSFLTRTPVRVRAVPRATWALAVFGALGTVSTTAWSAPAFPDQDVVCGFNPEREQQRLASAQAFATPVVQQMLVNGALVWQAGGAPGRPTLRPGDLVVLKGRGFGAGTDIDFSKIMIGNSRVLETDLTMYEQKLDILSSANYETGKVRYQWPKDIVSWRDDEVAFRVPSHVSKGPLKLQVQKRLGALESLKKPGQPHRVIDAQRNRLTSGGDPNCDVVSVLSDEVKGITPRP